MGRGQGQIFSRSKPNKDKATILVLELSSRSRTYSPRGPRP